MKNDKIKYIIIGIAVIVIVLLVFLIKAMFPSLSDKLPTGTAKNYYTVSTEKKMENDTYTNEALKSSHCLNSICIENATFYYSSASGRVEYMIVNQSTETASGMMKMVFGDQYLIVAYQDLGPNQRLKTSSAFEMMTIDSKADYVLQDLTEAEKSTIVYKNK